MNQTRESFELMKSGLLLNQTLVGTLYPGGGVLVSGWPSLYPEVDLDTPRPKRGVIQNASAKSLRRCSFNLQNSLSKWGVMITLTFREAHPYPRDVFRRWCSVMPWSRSSLSEWAWFREYQSRGVVHYHVILTENTLVQAFGNEALITDFVGSGKGRREVIRGRHEYWIVSRWIEAVGDTSSAFEDFQWGGVAERIRNVDSPGRYLGCYASKASQKKLPRGENPGGRWWWISPASGIVPCGTFRLWDWPLDYPATMLFDFKLLQRNSDLEVLPGGPK